MSRLLLFTNTYPYGNGETFLNDEIPFLASGFDSIIIYPLFIPKDENPDNIMNNRCSMFDNIIVRDPLLPCENRDIVRLLANACRSLPRGWQLAEFFSKRCFLSGKRLRLFINYYCIYNTIVSNKKTWLTLINDIAKNDIDIAYFYWGDISAMLIPTLKSLIHSGNTQSCKRLPKFVVRFHGSDLYEEAKGYLPFRGRYMKEIDYAIPISETGAKYLKESYKTCPPHNIISFKLGSAGEYGSAKNVGDNNLFNIVSCSNVIPLKRVKLIAQALHVISSSEKLKQMIRQNGYDGLRWVHMGDGPLLKDIMDYMSKNVSDFIDYKFTGRIAHADVLNHYNSTKCDLFMQVSTSEGIPVSIMEALSYRIPVLATDVGGVHEIINNNSDHEYSKLVEPNLTEYKLADYISEFAAINPDKLLLMKQAARLEWEKNWDSNNNYPKFVTFLQNICKREKC